MDKSKVEQMIPQAFDISLSGLQEDPWLAQRVIAQAQNPGKEQVKVKKKFSVGLILAMILILLSVTAIAGVAVYQYYQRAIRNEAAYGAYQQWPLAEKLNFIDQLVSEGVSLDADKLSLLQDASLSQDEQERLADEIITSHFGEGHDGSLSAVNMMEADKGPFDTWSLEDKAWMSETARDAGSAETDYEMHQLPGSGDITQDEALRLARRAVTETYGVDAAEVEQWPSTINFLTEQVDDGDAPAYHRTVYDVALYSPYSDVHPYFVKLSRTGELLNICKPFGMERTINQEITARMGSFVTVADKARFAKEVAPFVQDAVREGENVADYYQYLASVLYLDESAQYLDEDAARAKAEQALLDQGWDDQRLALYTPWVSLRAVTVDTAKAHAEPEQTGAVWYLKYKFIQEEEIDAMYRRGEIPWGVIVTMDATTGEILSIAEYTEADPFSAMPE